MPSQGPNEGSSASTNNEGLGGDVDWTNPSDALVDDGSRATCEVVSAGSFGYSYALNLTDFGFSIPGGSSIDSLLVELLSHYDGDEVCFYLGRVLYPGHTTLDTSSYTLAQIDIPASTDGWVTLPQGLTQTLSASDVNASSFGAALLFTSMNLTATGTVSVDAVRITVDYTLPGPISGSSAWLVAASATLTNVGTTLGGNVALVAVGSATASGAGKLAGASSPLLGSSALLHGSGALSSVAAVTTAASAYYIGSAASAPCALAGSAILLGAGSLSGSSAITTGASFSEGGVFVIEASVALALTATPAFLQGLAPLLAGSVTLVTTASEPHSWLNGHADATVIGVAGMLGAGTLRGSATLSSATSASLLGSGHMTAPPVPVHLVASDASTLSGAGSLSGQSALVVAPIVALTGRAACRSVMPLTIGTVALAKGDGALRAVSTTVSLTATVLGGTLAGSATAPLVMTAVGTLFPAEDQWVGELVQQRIVGDIALTEDPMSVPSVLQIGDDFSFQLQNVRSDLTQAQQSAATVAFELLDQLTRRVVAAGVMALVSGSTFEAKVDGEDLGQWDQFSNPAGLRPGHKYELRCLATALGISTTSKAVMTAVL